MTNIVTINCPVCEGYCDRDGEEDGCKFCEGEGTFWVDEPLLGDLENGAKEFMTKHQLSSGRAFARELLKVSSAAKRSIKTILLSKDRTSKHLPYTWENEDEDEHLNKAVRHILTYQLIRDGHHDPTGEACLNNAITRLAMAIAKKVEKEDGEETEPKDVNKSSSL